MGPQDGVDIVVRAADMIVHELGREDIAFTLIGTGDCYEELLELRDSLGLGDAVEFTGRAPDELVARILSTADIGLSPDPKNPLNDVSTMNKTMEYMAFGLPPSRSTCTRPGSRPGDAAVYATPNEIEDYARQDRRAARRRTSPQGDVRHRKGPDRRRARMAAPARELTSGLRPTAARGWASAGADQARSAPRSHGLREGPAVCGIAGCYQQTDGEILVQVHERADRTSRPGRVRALFVR